MKEPELMRSIMIEATKLGSRLFRNNVGKGWIGKSTQIKVRQSIIVEPGDVVIKKARRFNSGLSKGSSDLIGWTPVKITDDMVGIEIAVFTSVEVKTEAGKASTAQENWLSAVANFGGIGGVVKSTDDICLLIKKFDK